MSKSLRIVKKYSNRRLYDTEESRYITLDELAGYIREGDEVKVIDAKSGDDLTQATLVQIVLESRGAARLMPVPVLTHLIRMEENALHEFMSAYMLYALELYENARRGWQGMSQLNPFSMTMRAMSPAQKWFSIPGWPGQGESNAPQQPPVTPAEPVEPAGPPAEADDVGELRQELNDLKDMIRAMAAAQKPGDD